MKTTTLLKSLTFFTILSLLAACQNNNTRDLSSPNHSPTLVSASVADSAKPKDTAKVTKINVTAKEMVFQLSSGTAPAGFVEFIVKNEGTKPHEFVVLKNDMPNKKVALKGANLDEDAKGLKNLAEISQSKLRSGATQTLKLNLAPGHYLLVCNLPGHFQAGMRKEFIVK
jgi:uncharacterized cupredoxin-like copper-binding protein